VAIPDEYAGPATPAIRTVWRRVARNWGGTSLENWGVFVCRRIAGSSTWSQHAYGNAVDFHASTTVMDAIAGYCRGESMRDVVAQVLWKVPDHWDHVHVSGRPMHTGLPACAGGEEEQILREVRQRPLRREAIRSTADTESWAAVIAAGRRGLSRESERMITVVRRLERSMRR
jgi:hypothetical protein